jgi:hypothetical protein
MPDRANNVTRFLQQEGRIPLTNMLAPGAMGESRQVGTDKTAEGEAQNRRVVVRVRQNKGIAGTQQWRKPVIQGQHPYRERSDIAVATGLQAERAPRACGGAQNGGSYREGPGVAR